LELLKEKVELEEKKIGDNEIERMSDGKVEKSEKV
jgi:hypothetical protein